MKKQICLEIPNEQMGLATLIAIIGGIALFTTGIWIGQIASLLLA